MAIISAEELLQRCHHRHKKPLRQRMTVATPTVYTKDYPHEYAIYCAHRYPVMLYDLEQSDISFRSINIPPDPDQEAVDFESHHQFWQRRRSWKIRQWNTSWGIQIDTGIPSEREGARWHDLHFTYQALCTAPDAVLACVEALVNIVENPLLTLEKSGGLRFTCRVQDYLHPDTDEVQLYIYKHTPMPEDEHQRDVYLKISGDGGHTRWDSRYEILVGELLEPPVVAKEVLFAPIDTLRATLHEPASTELITPPPEMPLTFGSSDLDFAKDAFRKRGFVYDRQENGSYYWRSLDNTTAEVSFWKSDGIVWVQASAPDTGLPTEPTPIVEVWDDTSILPPMREIQKSIPAKVKHVRETGLSPLAIKRPPPVLEQQNQSEVDKNEILKRDAFQVESIFDRGVRILGIISGRDPWDNQTKTAYFHPDSPVCLNLTDPTLIEGANEYFQAEDMPPLVSWKPRNHGWESVKDIPIDERMKTPFQRGNVCEDADRCVALEMKGGNANESICPQCPVYTECQQRGYLSQFTELRKEKAQLLKMPKLFFDPKYSVLVEEILKSEDNAERICIVNQQKIFELTLECRLPKRVLETWVTDWQGEALGNFAQTLLSALEMKGKRYAAAVRGVRTAMQMFQWQSELIVRQMSEVKVQGKVVARGFTDPETGEALARATLEFEGGSSAYIPLNDKATDALRAKGLPVFPLESFSMNEDLNVLMPMAQAIALGILDTETVESIQAFPTVCGKQNWTFWHQLERFFTHYTRDADAPVRWNGEVLRFWVPPVLHPSVKRLLVISSVHSEEYLQRAFPGEKLETYRSEPIPWVKGNRVFQIRTGVYPMEAILDFHNWGWVGVTKIGQRFLQGIHAEVVKDPSIKHGILANAKIARRLKDIEKNGNVRFIDTFNNVKKSGTLSEAADVVWIIGTPRQRRAFVWWVAQIFFGNDEEPLSYAEVESGTYKDPRVQGIRESVVVGLFRRVIAKSELDRFAGKKIVLISGLPIPNITNRPETALFDWEDLEIAGGLAELPEGIVTRERFEEEREKLTAASSRQEVERVLGCSIRQANRVLNKLRGGNIPRIPIREQILTLLDNGEKETQELTGAIKAHPEAIHYVLAQLISEKVIARVRRGLYALVKE